MEFTMTTKPGNIFRSEFRTYLLSNHPNELKLSVRSAYAIRITGPEVCSTVRDRGIPSQKLCSSDII